MQAFYEPVFERDMACTEAEWRRWLPEAVGSAPWQLDGNSARVTLGSGRLHLTWRSLPPRAIGLVRLPRLGVKFAFDGMTADQRFAFMQRFDLYTQRGGG